MWIGRDGQAWALTEAAASPTRRAQEASGDTTVRSPMPGTVITVNVSAGQTVMAGDEDAGYARGRALGDRRDKVVHHELGYVDHRGGGGRGGDGDHGKREAGDLHDTRAVRDTRVHGRARVLQDGLGVLGYELAFDGCKVPQRTCSASAAVATPSS